MVANRVALGYAGGAEPVNARLMDNGDGAFSFAHQPRQAANAQTVTIASAAAVSSSIDTREHGPRGLAVELPGAWTAANIAFEVSADDDTWIPVRDETGTRVAITGLQTAEAGAYIAPAEMWIVGSYAYLRLVSVNTSTGANLNQAAERTLKVNYLS